MKGIFVTYERNDASLREDFKNFTNNGVVSEYQFEANDVGDLVIKQALSPLAGGTIKSESIAIFSARTNWIVRLL